MRKVTLEMNLGKKSKARFPRRIPNNVKIKLTVPASEAKSMPPISTTMNVYTSETKVFCEDFNMMSKDYDSGFPIPLNIWITPTKNYYYSFRSPSCFEMFHRCFDFYEGTDLRLSEGQVLMCAINISLIKNVDTENIFFDNFVSCFKQVLGSLRSYGYKQKKQNTKKHLNNKMFRKNNLIFNTKFTRHKI